MKQKVDNTLISRSLRAETKKQKITEREKAFADLVAMGWVSFDAYVLTGLYNPVYSKEANEREMNALMGEANFDSYLKLAGKRLRRKEQEKETEDIDIDLQKELSKEEQIKEYLIAKRNNKVGSPEWFKAKEQIAKLTEAQKEKMENEKKTIHYYIPLSCYNCPLYAEHRNK